MTNRELTDEADADRADFISGYGDGGCTCFLCPPCGYCTHPGNPHNQEGEEFYKPAPAPEVDVMRAVRDFCEGE